jgi:high affinity choline transporter 7
MVYIHVSYRNSLSSLKMALNWPGLLSIGVFYLIVLATGVWASRKSKREERKCTGNLSEVAMVGGRNLNIWVSIFTTTGVLST